MIRVVLHYHGISKSLRKNRRYWFKHGHCLSYHSQTSGKIENYHHTVKGELSLVLYEIPGDLENVIAAFVDYYNYRRYHEGLVDVTHDNVYVRRRPEIIQRRK